MLLVCTYPFFFIVVLCVGPRLLGVTRKLFTAASVLSSLLIAIIILVPLEGRFWGMVICLLLVFPLTWLLNNDVSRRVKMWMWGIPASLVMPKILLIAAAIYAGHVSRYPRLMSMSERFFTLAVIFAVLLLATGRTLAYRRRVAGSCASCGYNLSGNISGTCPECGSPVPTSAAKFEQKSPRPA